MLQRYAYSWGLERKGKSTQFCLEEHRKHCRGGSMWVETRKKGMTFPGTKLRELCVSI